MRFNGGVRVVREWDRAANRRLHRAQSGSEVRLLSTHAWRYGSIRPIADISASDDKYAVRVRSTLDALSKRAPTIVVFTLCAALIADWIDAPLWLPKAIAIVVGSLALMLMAARGRQHQFKTREELGFISGTEWIAYELAGKGTPPGYYLLGFFGFLTIMLTGFQSAYAMPAWAGFGLGVVWGIVNARYPADEEPES